MPPDSVVKTRADAPRRFFEAEAAGLAWLAEAEASGGVRIARVVDVSPGRIALERIVRGRPDAAAASAFGRALAATHDAGAAAFGAPPDDWDGPLYIGRLPQPSAQESTWGVFYARDRVLPFVEPAVRAGNMSERDAAVVRDACDLIASGAFDDDDPPSRLHGDLWNGNVLWSPDGVALIDPAAHGGHRETDLAMLQLFGCPFLDVVLRAYDEAHPLRPGWRSRIPVHRLHPLAVHAVGHGPSYGDALADAARAVMELG